VIKFIRLLTNPCREKPAVSTEYLAG